MLIQRILEVGELTHPIWVSRDSLVILNGHHRVEALRRLGALHAPAWVMDYAGPSVRVERWSPGPRISKSEVVERAREGRLFPPKTTRHHLLFEPPTRRTPLEQLLPHGKASDHAEAAAAAESRAR